MTLPTIPHVLDAALAARPDAPALIGRSGTLTYAELDRAADAAAGALWELGVRPGDRVAGCLPNDLGVVVAFHGAQRIGAVWAGIGEALTAVEQQTLVDICAPRVVLAGPHCAVDGPHVVDSARWTKALEAAGPAPAVPVDPHAPAGIAFSSGTTGAPKAIVHSQHNLVLPAAVLVVSRGWGLELRKGDSLPFTILNMLVLSTLATAQAQGCSIIMDRRNSDGIAEWIGRTGATFWNGAPAQLFDFAHRSDLDLHTLREVWSGGGDCPEHVRAAFQATHGIAATATYGLSEAPTVVAIDPIDGTHHPGASGQVLPHLAVTARDEAGRPLPAGEVGELTLAASKTGRWAGVWRPPLGYWEDGRVRPFGSDVVRTGDVGSVDAENWLTMVDRKKLMVVRGGANVSPAEVERVLSEHPAVSSAVVFGVADDRLGERVAALIVPARDDLEASALVAFCSERLARYKIPEFWGRCESLPTNAMGKIVRTNLDEVLRAAPQL